MKIDWKGVGVPLIAIIITFLGLSLTFIVSSLFRPDVSIDVMINNESNHSVTVNLNNRGYAAASNLKFTMEFPHSISTSTIFSTEKYNKTNTSSVLVMDIPRLAQGEGSVVRIDASIDPKSTIITTDKYNVYSAYDQGSNAAVGKNTYILPQPPLGLFEEVRNAWNTSFTLFFGIGIIVISIILFFGHFYNLQKKKRYDMEREDKERRDEGRKKENK